MVPAGEHIQTPVEVPSGADGQVTEGLTCTMEGLLRIISHEQRQKSHLH